MATPALVEPNLHMYPSLIQLHQNETTVYNSPMAALLPPNDASIISLLAAEARRSHELETELKKSAFVQPDPSTNYASDSTSDPVNRLILGFRQQIQKEHEFQADLTSYDEGRRDEWSYVEKTWVVRFSESYIARKTLELLYASQMSDLDSKPFPLFRLPPELRLKVYRYALGGDCRRILVSSMDDNILDDDLDRYRKYGGAPWYGDRFHPHWQKPSFKIRSERVGFGMGISTAILRTSRSVHEEAESCLYQLHEFDFSTGVFGVVPFLRSISHSARQNISCLAMFLYNMNLDIGDTSEPMSTEQTMMYNMLYNVFDWGPTCSYIAKNVRLREFAFGLLWEAPKDFRQLSWVQDMAQIKGLRTLTYDGHTGGVYHEFCEKSDLQYKGCEACEKLGPDSQALLAYLESEMLASAATRTRTELTDTISEPSSCITDSI